MTSSGSERLDLDDSDAAYEMLAAHIEKFVAAWESGGEPPRLTDYLPDCAAALRNLGLIELIKVDLEYRVRRGCLRSLDDYFDEFPHLVADGTVPLDLIYEDIHIRKQADETVVLQQYFDRFPDHRTKLEQLLGMGGQFHSTRAFISSAAVEAEVGQQLDDFDLIKELGAGAFAKVFLARQISMQRFVALKVSADESDEPQTLAQLDHPHIVRVFDQRVLAEQQTRLLYMQYVPGGTLQDVIAAAKKVSAGQRSGKLVLEVVDDLLQQRGELLPSDSFSRRALNDLSWHEAVSRLGASLASALAYAHDRGVLHRDVKPANVLLTAEGSPQLADFNISFSSQVEGSGPREFFGGSLAYMSPEQLEAYDPNHPRQPEEMDGRSDIYSLAVMLWEMLSGHRPFEDQMLARGIEATIRDMTQRRRKGVPETALRQLPADCPLGLADVLLKCLQPEADDRFANADQVSRQLELCLEADVQDLLYPPTDAWRAAVGRWPLGSWLLAITPKNWRRSAAVWPLSMVLLAALVPNVMMTFLIIRYNANAIIKMFRKAGITDLFQDVQLQSVNTVAYTLGIGVVVYLFWPVKMALTKVRQGNSLHNAEWRRAGNRCLKMGQFTGRVTLALWIVTGFVYPAWLQLASPAISWNVYLHFFASQLICGLIAASLTYFLVTCISVRAFYPRLIPPDAQDADAAKELHQAKAPVKRHFFVLFAVPALALAVAFFFVKYMAEAGNAVPTSFAVLGLIGAAGTCLCFFKLGPAIQSDLAALELAVNPGGGKLHRDADAGSLLASTRIRGGG